MRNVLTYQAVTVVASLVVSLPALAQQCLAPATTTPLTDTERKSVVFTSEKDASVLAKFDLRRTLDSILKTASGGTTPTDAQREALLESLLAGLRVTTSTNDESGIAFPVEPRPGEFDAAAFAHYRELIATVRAAGMEPMLTLLHFTWPVHVSTSTSAK